jgi:phage shock protein A
VARSRRRRDRPSQGLRNLTQQVEKLAALVESMERGRTAPPVRSDLWSMSQDLGKLAYRVDALEDTRSGASASLVQIRDQIRALEQRIDALAQRLPPAPR